MKIKGRNGLYNFSSFFSFFMDQEDGEEDGEERRTIFLPDTRLRKDRFVYDGSQWETFEKMYQEYKNEKTVVDDVSAYVLRQLRKKYSGYKSQDKKKKKFDETQYISFEELLEKLHECQLKCYYCRQPTMVIFDKKKEGLQWSLERFNNNLGHYPSNTCISCLKCNLSRRTDNHEYFKMGKSLLVEKTP
jgi:hypothetical protein